MSHNNRPGKGTGYQTGAKEFWDKVYNSQEPTPEENVGLVSRFQAGDKAALEELLVRNGRLVHSFVRKKYPNSLMQEDLEQEGFLAIMHAAEMYDMGQEASFSTYAMYWIKMMLSRYENKYNKKIHVPAHIGNISCKVAKENQEREKRGLPPMQDAEVAQTYGGCVKGDILAYLRMAGTAATTESLNEKLENSEGDRTELIDLVAGRSDTEQEAIQGILEENFHAYLARTLTEMEYDTLARRYGLRCPEETQAEIARNYGVTRQWIAKLQRRAEEKIYRNRFSLARCIGT